MSERMDMGFEPLVSVLVASFNHEPYIRQALDSLSLQTYRNVEVLIVDDCSPDDSVERIREWMDESEFPIQFVLNEENRGICAVLNQLVALASGELLVYLDSDDWFEPNRIELHVDHFAPLGPDVAVVFSDTEFRNQDGSRAGGTFLQLLFPEGSPPEGSGVFDRLLVGNFIPTPSVTVRRSAIIEIGGYDERLYYDDYDMWLRLSHRFRFSYCVGVVANYRKLETSMSHSASNGHAMAQSATMLLERWVESPDVLESPARRRSLATNLRAQARRIAPYDSDRACVILSMAQQLDPSVPWGLIDGLRVYRWPCGPGLVRVLTGWWSAASSAVRGGSK